MKAEVPDDIHDLPGLVAVSVYDTKPLHFLSMYCHTIKCVKKTRQLYDHTTHMVRDTYFLRLNVNYSYNYNMNLVYLSDQFRNVYQVDHWIRKYKW